MYPAWADAQGPLALGRQAMHAGNAAGTLPFDDPVVMDDGYRSYVIRVRRRPGTADDPGSQTRLDVEDLLEGGTATVSGDSAQSLASSLERLIDSARASVPSDPVAQEPIQHS